MYIIQNLVEASKNGCTLIGSLTIALTLAIQEELPGGCVQVLDTKEILISQHHNAGNFQLILKF
jgi:hypothetical protein